MSSEIHWLEPDWPVPPRVRVISTLRTGGVSTGPYASLNLAAHVGDRAEAVVENRRRLREAATLPGEPLWLEQVHGVDVLVHEGTAASRSADASVAFVPARVCAVLTADCLPIVLADRAGTRVGVAHAGWRGLLAGVVEAIIARLGSEPGDLVAWLGPAIGAGAFEVGAEVRDAYARRSAGLAAAFVANDRGRFNADLCGLARAILAGAGVDAVHGGGWCTHTEAARFYSFRRDGVTGRMATLAWLA
jgi:YfiH family protein